MNSPGRRLPLLSLPAAAVLLAAAVARALDPHAQPPLTYSVSAPIRGGETVEVLVPRFGNRRLICSAFFSGTGVKSDEVPCGPSNVILRMIPPLGLAASKLYLGISACTGSLKNGGPGVECWSYGGDVRYVTAESPSAAAVTPGAARAAAAGGAPGGISDGAPAMLRSAAPAAPPAPAQAAGVGSHWSAEGSAKPPEPPAVKPPGSREFRGHDGRMYLREEPAKGTLADKDERYRAALAADPAVREAFDNWRDLDDAGRRNALQRISDIQAAAYGVAPSQVVMTPGGKPGEVAHYNPADRKMTMNTSSPYYNSPTMQINAISHEARHRWQHSLVERLPTLAPASEEQVLGQAFKISFDNYCSPGGTPRSCDYATYRNQLVERDAFDQGEAAALYLRSHR